MVISNQARFKLINMSILEHDVEVREAARRFLAAENGKDLKETFDAWPEFQWVLFKALSR